MPSLTKAALLTAVRVGIVIVGTGVTALTVLELAAMPPPPPGSDGFAHGMAGIFGGLIVLSSLGIATVTVVLPTLLGWDDPLGFNRWQRLALKLAGGLVGVGIVVVLVTGLGGVFRLLGLVVLAFGVVSVTLVWRFVEVVTGRLIRADGTT